MLLSIKLGNTRRLPRSFCWSWRQQTLLEITTLGPHRPHLSNCHASRHRRKSTRGSALKWKFWSPNKQIRGSPLWHWSCKIPHSLTCSVLWFAHNVWTLVCKALWKRCTGTLLQSASTLLGAQQSICSCLLLLLLCFLPLRFDWELLELLLGAPLPSSCEWWQKRWLDAVDHCHRNPRSGYSSQGALAMGQEALL